MKAILFATASFILLAPQVLARDIVYTSKPVAEAGFFPQSAGVSPRELKGGHHGSGTNVSSPTRIIRVTARPQRSGIRIFRGSVVTEHGRSQAPAMDASLAGKTVIRLKKPPRNPYKTVIVYAPGSVRHVRIGRNPE